MPDEVLSELQSQVQTSGMGAFPTPPWLERRTVANRPLVDSLCLELDAGEAEAIALAVETKAHLVLLDERLARRVGVKLGLRVIGLLGLLAEASAEA